MAKGNRRRKGKPEPANLNILLAEADAIRTNVHSGLEPGSRVPGENGLLRTLLKIHEEGGVKVELTAREEAQFKMAKAASETFHHSKR